MNESTRGRDNGTQGGGPRFVLVAGETSGDALGAGLVEELRRHFPDARFAGIGGDAMRNAGVETWHDASELAVMGLFEVLRHLPRLLRLRREFRARALAWAPDVLVGIDAPDFNLGVERWFKQRGVATVHYVSPSVWAWREKRAAKIGASADRVLCLFPMEPAIYARHGVDARFVGHPMADAMPLQPDRAAARAQLGLPAGAPVLAVLPGSRLGEIERLGEVFFEAAWHVSESMPTLQVVVPAANARCRAVLEAQLARAALPKAQTRVLDGQARAALAQDEGRARRSIMLEQYVLADGTTKDWDLPGTLEQRFRDRLAELALIAPSRQDYVGEWINASGALDISRDGNIYRIDANPVDIGFLAWTCEFEGRMHRTKDGLELDDVEGETVHVRMRGGVLIVEHRPTPGGFIGTCGANGSISGTYFPTRPKPKPPAGLNSGAPLEFTNP